MRPIHALLSGGTILVLCLCLPLMAHSEPQVVTTQTPKADSRRAVAITEAGDAVLREDGQVIGFSNNAEYGEDPVFIESLANIVDVAGASERGLGPEWPGGSAHWIALRRDGIVLQWERQCPAAGRVRCRFSRATVAPGLRDVVAIASSGGTHLAVDRNGRAWGWGWDQDGLITGRNGGPDKRSWLIKTPVRIPVPVALTAIAVGMPHSMGIDRAGNVWLWGGSLWPQSQPERSEIFVDGEFVARKVLGIPPARSAAAYRRTYIVTDTGELWSWGITNELGSPPIGTRDPHRIEGICPVKSVSSTVGWAAAVCEDGSIYRMILPGMIVRSPVCCKAEFVKEERWERPEPTKNVEVLRLSATSVAIIDRSGSVYVGKSAAIDDVLSKIAGPINIDPQGK